MCMGLEILGALGISEGVGTAIAAIGTLWQAGAQASAASASADIAEQNAKLAEQQGFAELQRNRLERDRISRQAKRIQGTQRAAYGASGLDPNTGSALELQADTEYQAAQDIALVRYQAELKKWGFDSEAVNYRNQAKQYRAQGSNAMISGILGAGSSILTGNSSLFGGRWNNTGFWATDTYGGATGMSGNRRLGWWEI